MHKTGRSKMYIIDFMNLKKDIKDAMTINPRYD